MKSKFFLAMAMVFLISIFGCGGTDTDNNGEDALIYYNFDEYNDGDVPSDWFFVDEAKADTLGPSDWSIASKQLYQASKIGGTDTTFTETDTTQNLYGTFAYVGNQDWTDYVFEAKFKAVDNNGLGFIFRHSTTEDGKHVFYRFLMVNDKLFGGECFRLDYYDGEEYHLIKKTDRLSFDMNTTYNMKIEVYGTLIKVYRNEWLCMELNDVSLSKGNVGLFCMANKAYFDDIKVTAYGY
ncbi:MAG: DUF1080 domain-containing protein [Candidatus Coatesbacteria bacterium]|nr:DUF1080 domain-containing protein [Candidatus Coatesbacteria bacterium]